MDGIIWWLFKDWSATRCVNHKDAQKGRWISLNNPPELLTRYHRWCPLIESGLIYAERGCEEPLRNTHVMFEDSAGSPAPTAGRKVGGVLGSIHHSRTWRSCSGTDQSLTGRRMGHGWIRWRESPDGRACTVDGNVWMSMSHRPLSPTSLDSATTNQKRRLFWRIMEETGRHWKRILHWSSKGNHFLSTPFVSHSHLCCPLHYCRSVKPHPQTLCMALSPPLPDRPMWLV